MTIWNAILLGLVQGIAEFLPISSSGHLSILQNLFHMSTAENGHLFFDVLLHLGTLISICIVYWRARRSRFSAAHGCRPSSAGSSFPPRAWCS